MKELHFAINMLKHEDDEITIDDFDTGFTIWINEDKSYFFQMFQCELYRLTIKDKETLLKLLGNDISVLKKMQENKEAFNFECKSI